MTPKIVHAWCHDCRQQHAYVYASEAQRHHALSEWHAKQSGAVAEPDTAVTDTHPQ